MLSTMLPLSCLFSRRGKYVGAAQGKLNFTGLSLPKPCTFGLARMNPHGQDWANCLKCTDEDGTSGSLPDCTATSVDFALVKQVAGEENHCKVETRWLAHAWSACQPCCDDFSPLRSTHGPLAENMLRDAGAESTLILLGRVPVQAPRDDRFLFSSQRQQVCRTTVA